MEIGSYIRAKRKEFGLTQKQLAEKLNLSHSYLSQVELGDKNITPETLAKLSKVLNVSYTELMRIAGFIEIYSDDTLKEMLVISSRKEEHIELGKKLMHLSQIHLETKDPKKSELLQKEIEETLIKIQSIREPYMLDNIYDYETITSLINTQIINLEEILNNDNDVFLYGNILTNSEKRKALAILELVFN